MLGVAWRAWGRDHQDLVDRLKGKAHNTQAGRTRGWTRASRVRRAPVADAARSLFLLTVRSSSSFSLSLSLSASGAACLSSSSFSSVSLENDILRTPDVEHAFRLTDRALFVPPTESQLAAHRAAQAASQPAGGAPPAGAPSSGSTQAYIDGPVKVGSVHLSAPHMYALVLEKLGLERGMSFLNVGSGSGYLSCMAAVMVGRGGKSHGVERLPEVVEHANKATKRWRRRMDDMAREQRKRHRQQQQHQPPQEEKAMHVDPAPSSTVAASSSGSDRTSPNEMDSSTDDATIVAPHTLQRGFAAVDLTSPSGEPRRGVLGFAADLPSQESGGRSRAAGGGDIDVAAALSRSIVPFHDIVANRMVPRRSSSPLPLPLPSPSPSIESAQPSPTPSPSIPVPSSRYQPEYTDAPIQPAAAPEYIVGDAFDLDPEVCGRYDRIAVGAGTPESYIPFFVSLLHPGGRLCGPFGSSMQLISKSREGVIAAERISEVAYAPMVLPSDDARTAPKPQLRFSQPVFDPMATPDSAAFDCLPKRMQAAIDAMVMLQRRNGAECPIGRLPLSLLANVLTFLPVDSYLDRTTGDVPWRPDCFELLTLARTKHSLADAIQHEGTEEEKEESTTKAEQLLLEAIGHLEVVKDWLEIRLPTQVPALDVDAPPVGDAALLSLLAPQPVTVGGVVRDVSALRELRANPQRVGSGRTIRDDPIDQVVQLAWLLQWSLCQLHSAKGNSAGARAAKRLLAFRPNDTVAWRMLSLNAFADGNLVEAAKACQFAQRCSSLDGEPDSERETTTHLLQLIQSRMPAYRRQQQQVSNRLIHMLVAELMGGHQPHDEQQGEEGEEEEEEEEGEDEPMET